MKNKTSKCPRCGGTESFKDDCKGFLKQEIEWCSRCGYVMQEVSDLAAAVRDATNGTVIIAK